MRHAGTPRIGNPGDTEVSGFPRLHVPNDQRADFGHGVHGVAHALAPKSAVLSRHRRGEVIDPPGGHFIDEHTPDFQRVPPLPGRDRCAV